MNRPYLCPGGASAFIVWPPAKANRNEAVEGSAIRYLNTSLYLQASSTA